MPSIVDLLLRDHHKVEEMFSELDSKGSGNLEEYFCELREELVRHEVAEELIVYPAFRKHVPNAEEIAEACIAEQSEAEEALAKLDKQEHAGPSFLAELAELKRSVLAHAKHEERDVFPALSSHADAAELDKLAQRYEKALTAAPTHPHPHAPDSPPGNMVLGPVAAIADRIRDAMRNAA